MNLSLFTICVLLGSCLSSAASDADENSKNSEIALDFEDTDKVTALDNGKSLEVKKRESGYSYNRPSKHSSNLHRRRRPLRRPSQINRPHSQYGLPNHQSEAVNSGTRYNSPLTQQHQFPSSTFTNHDIPSSLKNVDFIEASPIASQNNEPFNSNGASYLPPKNQKLPSYAAVDTFSPQPANFFSHNNGQFANQQIQNGIQDSHQISDATLFLTQNAQAISQLYGAAAPNQNYAPSNEDFSDPNNQAEQLDNAIPATENTQSPVRIQTAQNFPGSLPGYASGILNERETLQRIQSLEKDRLIFQLQQALLQNAETSGRYVQNQNHLAATASGFLPESEELKATQNEDLLGRPDIFGPSGYGFNYAFSTTPQTPTSSSHRPSLIPNHDVGVSTGPSSYGPGQPSGTPGFPQYGGFIPSAFPGNGFIPDTPIFDPSKPIEPSPMHFVIPIPGFGAQKPASAGSPTFTGPNASAPFAPGFPFSIPIKPAHPSISSIHPVTTQIRPIVPGNPISAVHPVVTPVVAPPAHPTFGTQSPVVNPVIYKPIKGVYPFYYQTNLALQELKHAAQTNPWSYANTFSAGKRIWN